MSTNVYRVPAQLRELLVPHHSTFCTAEKFFCDSSLIQRTFDIIRSSIRIIPNKGFLMELQCPDCNNLLDIPAEADGRKVECPYCGNKYFCSGGLLLATSGQPTQQKKEYARRRVKRPIAATAIMVLLYFRAFGSLLNAFGYFFLIGTTIGLISVALTVACLIFCYICAEGYRIGDNKANRAIIFLLIIDVLSFFIAQTMIASDDATTFTTGLSLVYIALYVILYLVNTTHNVRAWLEYGPEQPILIVKGSDNQSQLNGSQNIPAKKTVSPSNNRAPLFKRILFQAVAPLNWITQPRRAHTTFSVAVLVIGYFWFYRDLYPYIAHGGILTHYRQTDMNTIVVVGRAAGILIMIFAMVAFCRKSRA